MMLEKFLISANQKHLIRSRDEWELYNPWLRLLGDEVKFAQQLLQFTGKEKNNAKNVIYKYSSTRDY